MKGRANYLGDEVQDEENGDDKVSNFSDESDDVDVKTKIFREIRCIYLLCMHVYIA